MKSNVKDMESEMDQLTKNMSKIIENVSRVNEALGTKRDKIRQLNSAHNLLKKVCIEVEINCIVF